MRPASRLRSVFCINTALILFSVCLVASTHAQSAGHLIIVGGGGIPKSMVTRFHELAAAQVSPGQEPLLVLIPTASSQEPVEPELTKYWRANGFEQVEILHTRDRKTANRQEFAKLLQSAHAVWFGGGAQSRLADAYLDTKVEQQLRALLNRGGVIGGTSAGAAIQSRVMIAGGRTEPKIARGLGLLESAIIDQHFLARNRFNRLMMAVVENPDLTGIGIDEVTGIEVHRNQATVRGRSIVTRIRKSAQSTTGWNVETFGHGETFELTPAENATENSRGKAQQDR